MKHASRYGQAAIAFLMYFLLVIGINSLPELYASITPQKEAAKVDDTKKWLQDLSENTLVANGFAAILSVVVAYATNVLTDQKDARPLDDDDHDRAENGGKGKTQPRKTRDEYTQSVLRRFKALQSDRKATQRELQKTVHKLYRVREVARRKFRLATILYVAIGFGLAHIPSQMIQAWVRSEFQLADGPPESSSKEVAGAQSAAESEGSSDKEKTPVWTEPLRFIVFFTQSICLSVSAFVIAFYFHRRFIKVVRRVTWRNGLLIGGGGILCAGCLHLLQDGPEQLTLLLENTGKLDYVRLTVLQYLVVSKLLIFPVFGLLGAGVAGKGWSPR